MFGFGGFAPGGPPDPSGMVGHVGGSPPAFTGLPLWPAELSEFEALRFVAEHPIKTLTPLERQRLLEWTDTIRSRFALRLRTLPGDAWPTWADQYSQEHVLAGRVSDVTEWQSLPPTDEFGRDYPGKSPSLAELAGELATFAAAYIPGAGPWVSAAIQLAQGKSLEDAALAGLRAALPGGPVAAMAFDFGIALASGAPVDEAALEILWTQYPDARAAYELGQLAVGGDADMAYLDTAATQWPAYGPLVAQAHLAEPSPALFFKSLVGPVQQPAAPTVPAVPMVPSLVRAHRATVPASERSWWIAGATVGLVPLSVVLARWFARRWSRG